MKKQISQNFKKHLLNDYDQNIRPDTVASSDEKQQQRQNSQMKKFNILDSEIKQNLSDQQKKEKQQQDEKKKKNDQRELAFKELKNGEIKYIQKLNFLNDMRHKLIQMNIIDPFIMEKLFTNIKQIFLFHSSNFLVDFQTLFEEGMLYKVQLKLDDFLLYQESIKFVEERIQIFQDLYQKNQDFQKFQDSNQYNIPHDKERVTTRDCINLPFDRLFKYGMIFDRILKYTDKNDDGFQALINVRNKMNKIVQRINGRTSLKDLQKNLRFQFDLCENESRLLIDQVETIQYNDQFYQAFILNDMIILKPKLLGQLKTIFLDDNSQIFDKQKVAEQKHRFQIKGVYTQDNVILNANSIEIVNQFKSAMNQMQTCEITEDININLIGTCQMHDGNYQVYTQYIIEITKGFQLTRLFLRSSQIKQISKICKMDFKQTRIGLQEKFSLFLFKNSREEINKKLISYELFLQQVFKNTLIQQQPITILNVCGLPHEFFQVCQTITDEKTIIQMNCGETLYEFEVFVELFYDENPKKFIINNNTNAYQLCKIISKELKLDNFDDFRLFIYTNGTIEVMIDNFQKLLVYKKKKQPLTLVFKQWIFLDNQERLEEIRLNLISNQILKDIRDLKYKMSIRDYAFACTLILILKKSKNIDYYIQKFIPYEILGLQDGYNIKETVIDLYFKLGNLITDLSQANYVLYNFVKEQQFYGCKFFWIKCSYKKTAKPKNVFVNLEFVWLCIDQNQIQLYDENKKIIKRNIDYNTIQGLQFLTKELEINQILGDDNTVIFLIQDY